MAEGRTKTSSARGGLRGRRAGGRVPKVSPPTAGIGLYTVQDAARFTHLAPPKIRRWIEGYDYRARDGERRTVHPVAPRHLDRLEGEIALTFKDLIEVYWVKTLLGQGVTMPKIREAAEEAEKLLASDHPFCQVRFTTDGAAVFARVLDEQERERILHLDRSGQFVFKGVIEPLLRELEYTDEGRDGVVRWWPLGRDRRVVLDPRVAFGAPVTRDEGVPTESLYRGWLAERDMERVAEWYAVSIDAVRDAVAFEEMHRTAAA